MESKSITGWVLHNACKSINERLEFALNGFGILVLFLSVKVDTRFPGAGRGGRDQPAHGILITPLGFIEAPIVDSVVYGDSVTYMAGDLVKVRGEIKPRRLTGRTELGESRRVAPSNGPAGESRRPNLFEDQLVFSAVTDVGEAD